MFLPQARGGECLLAALSAGGVGAFICKVIVTDYVFNTSADSGLPSVFWIIGVQKNK